MPQHAGVERLLLNSVIDRLGSDTDGRRRPRLAQMASRIGLHKAAIRISNSGGLGPRFPHRIDDLDPILFEQRRVAIALHRHESNPLVIVVMQSKTVGLRER